MQTILMIEDNLDIMKINSMALKNKYHILEATTLEDGKQLLFKENPDLLILDIMLPDGNGLDFCQEVRKTTDIPILMVTALGEDKDVVAGLTLGCDDYIGKPYDLEVLVARVEALLRRSRSNSGGEKIQLGPLSISTIPHVARLNGDELNLTPRELSILEILLSNKERYISSKELYRQVWGTDSFATKSIKQHIYMLRKKLGKDSPITIESMQGKGYRIICD